MAAKAHYACLALLFLLGIQLATCKSVDKTFKDDRYNTRILSLSKRDVDEENNEEETTTLSSEDNLESNNDEETTPILATSTPKPLKKRKTMKKKTTTTTTEANEDEPTTSSPEDGEEVQEGEAASAVKPLTTDNTKLKNRKKAKPATDAPMILDRMNTEEETPNTGPHFPKPPASNLLPPMPSNHYPQNYNGFLNPMQTQGSAPWGYNPLYSSPPTAYDYPRPSGPAFSDSKIGKGSNTLAVGNGFASASASASASANGLGGTVSTSTSPGNGYQNSPNSFNTRSDLIPAEGSRPNSGSFVNLRGSFPASDGESVAIEVNGPVSSGLPAYEPTYAGTGATSYTGSGSYMPNPYMNTAPNYGGTINPSDLQAFFQQYFAALQAQQQAFQRQLQAQIEAQRQAIWEQSNQVDSNFGAYGNSNGAPQSAYAGASLGSNGGFQSAHVSPAEPGIFSRFAEEVPPPSGKHFGVFSSSSSSSATGPDGKQVSHKSATVGVNDNGKVTYKTVHDP